MRSERCLWPCMRPCAHPRMHTALTLAVLFLVVIAQAFIVKRRAADNPYGEGATTLEWQVASPPPYHTFDELPKIK